MFSKHYFVSLMAALLCSPFTAAEDSLPWPDRNGPTRDGFVDEENGKGLPTAFNVETGENIKWKTPLENLGNSTPVIGGGKVWFTSATEDGAKQWVYCIDANSGEVLHHKLLFENENPEPLFNDVNTYASPSCVLESDAVYVHFGEYGTARLNPETADVEWQRRDLKCRHYRGPGSSPVIFEDLLILTFDGVSQQYLTALNKTTGESVWRTDRTTDYGDLDKDGNPKREGDLRKAFGTPGLLKVGNKTQVVSIGSRAAYGYDAVTGAEIWKIRHANFNAATPPAFFEDLVIINTGDRNAHTVAIEVDQSTKGDVTDTNIRWDRVKGNSRLATPLLIAGRFYMVTDTGVAICLDAKTGEEIWKGRIGGDHVASPIYANGLIYCFNVEGDMIVIRTGDKFELVSKSRLPSGMRASPAVADGKLYLRTFDHLYCIGK